MASELPWEISRSSNGEALLVPVGEWNIDHAEALYSAVERSEKATNAALRIDGSKLSSFDTSGAFFLVRLARKLGASQPEIPASGLDGAHAELFKLVLQRAVLEPPPPVRGFGVLGRIGRFSSNLWNGLYHLLAFLGATFAEIGWSLLHPRTLRLKELFVQLERVCVDALGIVALVMALIGVVVSYLFAIQLIKYGAHLFLVDGVTQAICRELSPIVVAILMAGRSGSAFTAQIGTMKLNEELDAMVTMGLSPMRVLVLPRVLALIIALPLLTFFGDLIGVAGGMVIANIYADISAFSFVQRVYVNFPIESFYIGVGKTPVFALFIATIGCRMGLTVENNAQSVGMHTTSTVVQSIVMIIILNAIFAVLFAEIGFFKT